MPPSLSLDQLAAAHHGAGPALVLGGPGTGKTVTVHARYRHLLERIGLAPGEVALFTPRPAAAERLRRSLGVEVTIEDPHLVGTCHELARRFLAEMLVARDEPAELRVLTPSRQRAVLRLLGVRWEHPGLPDVLDVIHQRKRELLSPEQWLELLRLRERTLSGGVAAAWFQASDIYFRYQEYLTAQGLMDLDDLLVRAVDLLRLPQTRRLWERKLARVLVDDAQHLSRAEFVFLRLLLDDDPGLQLGLWLAADDDQALGGQPGWEPLAHVLETEPTARVYPLTTCHRCTAQILQPAGRLIGLNTRRRPKTLVPTRLSGKTPAVITFATAADEAKWIADFVRQAHREGVPYDQIAILARLPEPLTTLRETLVATAPCIAVEAPSAWEHPIGATYAAFVQMAMDVEAGRAFAQLRLPAAARQRCREEAASRHGTTFAQACIAARNHVASSLSAVELSAGLANELHLLDTLHQVARGFRDLDAFVQHVAERRAPSVSGTAGVTLSTFAEAAGREWAVVVVMAMEDGEVPYDRGGDLEEERRQVYVALTRSRHVLNLCLARRRGDLQRNPSSFFFDLGGNLRRVTTDVAD